MVAVAVAVFGRDVGTPALVDFSWSVADAASIKLAYTFVDIVTDAVFVGVLYAVATTNANGIDLVPVTVAISFWNCGTAARVDGAWSVANATCIHEAYAVFHIIADAVVVDILCACATTDANDVLLVAIAVAVSLWDVSTSTFVDLTWSVADATCVEFTDAFVHFVADAIFVGVLCTVATTDAQGIELVPVTVAVSSRDVGTSAIVDFSWSVADAASI